MGLYVLMHHKSVVFDIAGSPAYGYLEPSLGGVSSNNRNDGAFATKIALHNDILHHEKQYTSGAPC
jgi:hypothetical protein